MSRALHLLLAAVAALVLAAPAAAAPRYVALGDSYAAGPIIPVQLPPFGCLKSSNNYGHLVQLQQPFPEFRDPSCSGAKTDHMTAPQGVTPGPNPPQFDSLSADTTAVTLTIGGNDIGFSSIAQNCFVTQPSSGSPCKDRYTAGGQDEISRRIADAAPKVAAVLQGIAARSPQATTYVVNYSAIFPHGAEAATRRCPSPRATCPTCARSRRSSMRCSRRRPPPRARARRRLRRERRPQRLRAAGPALGRAGHARVAGGAGAPEPDRDEGDGRPGDHCDAPMTVAVVTGASSGIGEATARLLAREHGVALVLVARREDRLRTLASELGSQTSFLACDLTYDEAPARVRAHAEERHGRLDLLVNNAGAAWRATFADGGWENVRRHMEVNFDAVVRLTEELLPLLRRSAPSAIVNVSSTAGRVARPGSGAYSASKFALAGWSDALAGEEAPNGVHVGLVLPGYITTEGFPQSELTDNRFTRRLVSTPERGAQAIVDAGLGRKHERYVPRPYGARRCRAGAGSAPRSARDGRQRRWPDGHAHRR